MLDLKSRVVTEKDLFVKLVEIYQTAYYTREDYLTNKEMDFLWASLNAQRNNSTKRLFDQAVLDEYEKYGFKKSNVNTLSARVADKKMAKRKKGEFYLINVMDQFSSKEPLKAKFDIIFDPDVEGE